jgi:hypothetical protein
MKIVGVTMLALMVGAGLQAGETQHDAERTVTVCLDGIAPQRVLAIAQGLASKMFAAIGLTIEWRHGLRDCPAQAIVVSLTDNTPAAFVPGALAYATPYEGTHIRVFCDRIISHHDSTLAPHLLAHVLAHEITHILQGVNRHSESGIMKAQWGFNDFSRMIFRPLAFTSDDIEMINRGLAGRTSRAASFHSPANPEIAAVTAQ